MPSGASSNICGIIFSFVAAMFTLAAIAQQGLGLSPRSGTVPLNYIFQFPLVLEPILDRSYRVRGMRK